MNELSKFFKVMTLLWVTEDYVADFQSYMDQLLPIVHSIFDI